MSAKTDKKQKESHEHFQWDRKIGAVLGRKIREKGIRRFEMILKSFITFFFFSSVEDIRIYSQGFRTVLTRYGFHVIMLKHYTNTVLLIFSRYLPLNKASLQSKQVNKQTTNPKTVSAEISRCSLSGMVLYHLMCGERENAMGATEVWRVLSVSVTGDAFLTMFHSTTQLSLNPLLSSGFVSYFWAFVGNLRLCLQSIPNSSEGGKTILQCLMRL